MSREVNIQNHWIQIIKNIGEFQQIAKGENPEFNELTVCIERLLLDCFVQDSTEYGVRRWESLLNIIPITGESLDDRKIRILTYLNVKLPYSWRVLKQTLTSILGENNFTMSYNNQTYTLDLYVQVTSLNQFHDIKNLLNIILPQNIILNLTRNDIQ